MSEKLEEKKEYYPNGNLKARYCTKNKNIDGEYISYYLNGEIEKKCFYKNGVLDGIYIYYYQGANGAMQKCFYENGLLNGECAEIQNDGRIVSKYFYKNGKLDGEYLVYDENKNIKKKCFYKDGILDGEYFEIDLIGHINCFYKNGKLDGIYTIIDYKEEDGKIIENIKREYLYKNDEKLFEKFYICGILHSEEYFNKNVIEDDDDEYDFSLAKKILKTTGKLAGKAVVGIGKAFVEEYKKNL